MSEGWREEYETLMASDPHSDRSAARTLYHRGVLSPEYVASAVVKALARDIGTYAREKNQTTGLPRFPASAEVDEEGCVIRKQLTFMTESDVDHNQAAGIGHAKDTLRTVLAWSDFREERWGSCPYRPTVERMLDLDYE